MVNYFDYDYPEPQDGDPFSRTMEMAPSPWTEGRHLVMIGLKGERIDETHNTNKNLVFLVDVSGSMQDQEKLPLIKDAFGMLVDSLTADDKISIVSYAADANIVLNPTPGNQKTLIKNTMNGLTAAGSTNVGTGLEKAYNMAEQAFIENGVNRVIMASDGDFNVGLTSQEDLLNFISDQRQNENIYMTVLGFGITDYDDDTMEVIADNGDGNYYYIDTQKEAYKVFVKELQSTLFAIARDVKLQVEFNPGVVERYRLIGYETRLLDNEDFGDDTKDAGEIGAGHTVTAFYEIEKTPDAPLPPISMRSDDFTPADFQDYEALELRIRYKEPDEDFSRFLSSRLVNTDKTTMSDDMAFSSAVVEFAMLLRQSQFREASSYDSVITRAQDNLGSDDYGLREEFVSIVQQVDSL